jgi:hypothetical protein
MNKKIIECGICLDSIELKHIDFSTELDCGHLFHDKCLKKWCISCLDNDTEPNCPLCRTDISGEYLEILGISQNETTSICTMIKTINLFQYIVKNKLYNDIDKLGRLMDNHPDEFDNIYHMLKGYCALNSLDNIFA